MPLYEYQCTDCGTFSASAAMAASALPAGCPQCSAKSPRILSPVASAGTRRARRRGVPEPKLVKSDREPQVRPKHIHPRPDRPWMLGH
jgi:putative FmdB family regulatory protein